MVYVMVCINAIYTYIQSVFNSSLPIFSVCEVEVWFLETGMTGQLLVLSN